MRASWLPGRSLVLDVGRKTLKPITLFATRRVSTRFGRGCRRDGIVRNSGRLQLRVPLAKSNLKPLNLVEGIKQLFSLCFEVEVVCLYSLKLQQQSLSVLATGGGNCPSS